MIYFLVAVIVLVVLVFGAASIAQSIAAAQQAQATIEVAKANQMATFANVAVISVMLIVLLAVLLLTVYLVFFRPRVSRRPHYVGVDMARGRDVSRAMIVRTPTLRATPSSPAAYGHRPGQYPDDFYTVGIDELTEFEKELLAYLEDRS